MIVEPFIIFSSSLEVMGERVYELEFRWCIFFNTNLDTICALV